MAVTLTATYDSVLSRIRLAAEYSGPEPDGNVGFVLFDRTTDGVNYTTVRGGSEVTVAGTEPGVPLPNASLDDYEWTPGVATTYRARFHTVAGALIADGTGTTAITQDLTQTWVKIVAKPYLNRPVIVQEVGGISRPARTGVFPVVGRSFPVAVSDVRGSRQFELQVLTETSAQARDFDLLLASGEPVFVHVPSTVTTVPGGYYSVGDTTQDRTGRISERRLFTLPLTEVAAPGPDVVGASGTWQTVLNTYPTWADLIADKATWGDVLELIGAPSDVIVP